MYTKQIKLNKKKMDPYWPISLFEKKWTVIHKTCESKRNRERIYWVEIKNRESKVNNLQQFRSTKTSINNYSIKLDVLPSFYQLASKSIDWASKAPANNHYIVMDNQSPGKKPYILRIYFALVQLCIGY